MCLGVVSRNHWLEFFCLHCSGYDHNGRSLFRPTNNPQSAPVRRPPVERTHFVIKTQNFTRVRAEEHEMRRFGELFDIQCLDIFT